MAKRILIVDDELDLLKIVTFRVKKAGYDIIAASDGQAALDLIQQQKPDLILLDLRLPIVDGWEVCRRIKADENLKYIPVILLSASASSMNQEKIKELNAQDYLMKPFDPEVLLEKIKDLIG